MFLSLRQCPVSGVWSLQTQVSVQLGCPFSPAHRERDRGGGERASKPPGARQLLPTQATSLPSFFWPVVTIP